MQGDILSPVHLFNCEDNSSQILCHFHLSCWFFWSFYYIISVWFLPLYLLSQGWQCTQCPQPLALTCFPPSEVLWFWSRCCWSALHVPLGLGLCLGRSLSVWEGYIHRLAPPGATPLVTWSGAVTRRRPAGASVPAVWPAEWSPGSSSVQSVGETSDEALIDAWQGVHMKIIDDVKGRTATVLNPTCKMYPRDRLLMNR